ncbi:MAG: 4-hydroxy-tetrahydrodipicolinate reductase [Alphaproteobacteria bacterium]|nr:4-hydroxy-tetrahydrodipicolinate reductase [Alphaproteobacteria bacterium]
MNIIIHGIKGRMGQSLIETARANNIANNITNNINVLAGIDLAPPIETTQTSNDIPLTADLNIIAQADIVIDFSTPEATLALVAQALKTQTPLVIGTTGFTAAQEAQINAAAQSLAIVKAGNMSLGINMLARLVEQAAQDLPDSWDIEIFEMHHSDKKDAPSGTALFLGEAAAEGRNIELPTPIIDRSGGRTKGEIGFSVARGGSVIGEHEVIFAGAGERLVLAHAAQDRTIFARGALTAASWLLGKPAGLYSLQDVLDTKNKGNNK